MRPSDKLLEGMREGDLADLVLPLISVDEYQSKVDPEECITFGFYVHDKDAANDLNRFLQKSSISVLDTEVSPAPDQHGYYMVFVELMDNDQIAETVTSLLAEIKSLVDIEDWQMRVRGTDELIAFSEDNLKQSLKHAEKKQKHQDVLEFLRTSMLSNVLFEGDLVVLEGAGETHVLHLVAFDRTSRLIETANLDSTSVGLTLRAVAKANRLRRSLGEGWEVLSLGKYLLVQSGSDPRGLLLHRPL